MKHGDIKRFARTHFPDSAVGGRCIHVDMSCAFTFTLYFQVAAQTAGLSYIWVSIQTLMDQNYDVNFTLGDRCRKPDNNQIWTDAEAFDRQFLTSPQYRLYSSLTREDKLYGFIKENYEAGRSDLRFLETAYYVAVYFGELGWAAEVSNHLERLMRGFPEQPWHAPLLTEVHAIRTLIHQSGPAATRTLLIRRALENRKRMGLPCNLCDAELKR